MRPQSVLALALPLGAVAAVALAATLPAKTPPTPTPTTTEMEPYDLDCDAPTAAARATVNPDARNAAQRGLSFLAADTVRWQGQNPCYGCHVQAVTLKAMAVGQHNQYDLGDGALEEVVRGITELKGGSRTPNGLGYGSGTYLSASRSLGGAAFARYDEWVGEGLRTDLLQTASQLLEMQTDAGHIANDYTSDPVAIGALQDTVLAMATWNQAYARTADDRWLTAVASAEDWLHGQASTFVASGSPGIQPLNYALMGLHEAGSSPTEALAQGLVSSVVERQGADGGWSLSTGGTSDAYATGQTLYTLRLMGRSDDDPAVARGTAWLIEHQDGNGGWSHGGRQRAEAMWGVLGLVSVDVLTLAVSGVQDGQHVDGPLKIEATAFDNQGGDVVQVELAVDDVPIDGACGHQLTATRDLSALPDGPHLVDLTATNSAGKVARRRFEVFTGSHYLTRLGSRWDDGGTVLSLRNGSVGADQKVQLTISTVDESNGAPEPLEALWTTELAGTQGAMSFYWDGTDTAGDAHGRDRYLARFSLLDSKGEVLHAAEHVFVHDTPEAQAQRFSQVGGKINFGSGGSAANTVVELVDKAGRVVRKTVTTKSGQYRFKNVDEGQYELRVQKDGFGERSMPMAAEAGAETVADDLEL